MYIIHRLKYLLFICLFLTNCGPKVIFQDKCKEEYGKLSCTQLESEYKDYRKKADAEKVLREQKSYGAPNSMINASSMRVDHYGNIFYKFESPAEEEHKWRLQTLREMLIERKCKTDLTFNDDIEVKVYTDSVYRRK